MTLRALSDGASPELARGKCCVVAALGDDPGAARRCLESLHAHTHAEVPIAAVARQELARQLDATPFEPRTVWVAAYGDSSGTGSDAGGDPLTAAVARALELLAPADIVLLVEPCEVSEGWLRRIHAAARGETNTASASALAVAGTPLAIAPGAVPQAPAEQLGRELSKRTLASHPRLEQIVGPCVCLRRDALELIGPLDATLPLEPALEIDVAQRCLLSGLQHVVADDVVVERLGRRASVAERPAVLRERYPYLSEPPSQAVSGVLARALHAARVPAARLPVTIDARALSEELTGTRIHVFELIRALAHTDSLSLRLLVSKLHGALAEELLELPHVQLQDVEQLDPAVSATTVFHRPQQAFSGEDVRLAFALGERVVLSQLDLIAYHNPGYFPDAEARESYRRASRQGLCAAERVIVSSEHTRRDLLADALVEEQRIRVVAPGLDHTASPDPRRPAELQLPAATQGSEPAAGTPFLLCLGTDFRHKNRVFALRMLAALRQRHAWEGTLVFAGAHIAHGSSRELERQLLAEDPQLASAVVELGAVDEGEKAWLMGNAAALVYPSVYEGFGFVPFEAALQGLPCVFAPYSSLAEVAPEGTATIVAWDATHSAAVVHSLLSDIDVRTRHIETLAAAARTLTWERTAGALVEIYAEVAAAPVRDAAAVVRDAVEREHALDHAYRTLLDRHESETAALVGEREHAKRMYDELNAEVGSGLSLIGPHGSLPEDVQRALLALSARPALSRPLYGAAARAFATARRLAGSSSQSLPRGRR